MELSNLIAKDLLSIRAVFFRPEEPFTWASGIKSPVYCDNRLTLTDVAVRTDVEQGLASLVKENYPDVEVLMGTSTAGIAHAAIVGHLMGLPMGYVRSGAKDHGRQNQIEGTAVLRKTSNTDSFACLETRSGTPGLMIPAFSPAIFSKVSPSKAVCSNSIRLIIVSSGFMIFVASRRPPQPVSITLYFA